MTRNVPELTDLDQECSGAGYHGVGHVELDGDGGARSGVGEQPGRLVSGEVVHGLVVDLEKTVSHVQDAAPGDRRSGRGGGGARLGGAAGVV